MLHSDILRLEKQHAALFGPDPKQVSGHSLRVRFVTIVAVHHARLREIKDITRHSNPSAMRIVVLADGGPFSR